MIHLMKTVCLLCAAALGFSACISDKKIIYLQGAETTYAVPTDIQQAFELRIQPDDQLAISVASKNKELIEPFNNNTLIGGGSNSNYSNTTNISSGVSYFQVDKEGNIEFPIFGTLHVGGKTCVELSRELQERLINEDYIKDAVVNTKIMSFKVTVLGDVKNPGMQKFEGERLTVLEAIGKAGDLNSSAKRENVLVVREENGNRVTYLMDLRDEKSVFNSPAYYLQQNDVVYVAPNKSVRVKGSTSYTLLSVSSTLVSMVVSIVSLIISLNR